MAGSSLLEKPLYAYARARSLGYTVEGTLLFLLAKVFPGRTEQLPKDNRELYQRIYEDLIELLHRDSANISEGIYPASVLIPESPVRHLRRLPKLLIDSYRVALRRYRGHTSEFSKKKVIEQLDDLPRYYRRNFHFQTDGYLSEHSAELYEHQVEILFQGAADPMRRLILRPLRDKFGKTDGRGLHLLELGAGTGRSSLFVREAFPKARITLVDLSDAYLRSAERKLSRFTDLDFVHADAADLPFRDARFDAVYSVFLFHELPLEERRAVIRESLRVLKPGGFVGLVDSIQKEDKPELDSVLEKFPRDFHEPFYRNYLETPMEGLFEEAKVAGVSKDTGYFSQVCWGEKRS